MLELSAALDAWRAAKSPALADAIDALTAQCPRTPAPRRDQHEHWMRAALVYDPIEACGLLDTAQLRLHKGDSPWPRVRERLGDDPIIARIVEACLRHFVPGRYRTAESVRELPVHQRNRIERLCAFARWPDDPRVATILAHWFARDGFAWSWPHEHGVEVVLDVLAEQLIRIGDVRVVPVVASCFERPRARSERLRAIQTNSARRIVDALGTSYVAPPARVADHGLWEAVAREPDDLAVRMVLADSLLAEGDRRGELIALMCSDEPKAHALAEQLLAEHWNTWLGDLALIVKRGESTFVRGTLDQVVIGLESSPSWAFGRLGDHRELITVRRVAQNWRRANAAEFGAFIGSLPDLARVELDLKAETLDELARLRPQWPTRAITLDVMSLTADRIAIAIDHVRALFPALASIEIKYWGPASAYIGSLPRLASVPRVVIKPSRWLDEASKADLTALMLAMPNVEVET